MPSGTKSGVRRILLRFLTSGALLPLFILLLWYIGSERDWWSSYLLPSPGAVAQSAEALLKSGELARHLTASVIRVLRGFTAAAAAALLLAFACGLSGALKRQVTPLLDFVRHVPPLAAIPLFILWFGIDEASKLAIIALSAFFPVYLNTFQGVSQCDPRLLEVGKVFGYSRIQRTVRILLPYSLPYILAGMRLGLGYSWRSLIAAELLAASSGIGFMIVEADQTARPDVIMVGILVIGVAGSLMDMGLSALIRRLPFSGGENALV